MPLFPHSSFSCSDSDPTPLEVKCEYLDDNKSIKQKKSILFFFVRNHFTKVKIHSSNIRAMMPKIIFRSIVCNSHRYNTPIPSNYIVSDVSIAEVIKDYFRLFFVLGSDQNLPEKPLGSGVGVGPTGFSHRSLGGAAGFSHR